MFIKIMGFITVLGSATTIGFFLAVKETFRINDLTELKKALMILQSEIQYVNAPLDEAFHHVAFRVKKPWQDIFKQVEEQIQSYSGEDISKIWFYAISDKKNKLFLGREDYEMVFSYGKTLGYLDKSLQMNSITLTVQYIDEKIALLNSNHTNNKKMYQSLGVLCGILVCVLFI